MSVANTGYAAKASLSAIRPMTDDAPKRGYSFCKSLGNFATFAAIQRASSLLIGELLAAVVAHNESRSGASVLN